jgi:hypothetical protein
MKSLLKDLTESAEIRDVHGELIGYFVPAKGEAAELRHLAFEQYDPEEIRRSKESRGPWHTTAQVLEHIRALERAGD